MHDIIFKGWDYEFAFENYHSHPLTFFEMYISLGILGGTMFYFCWYSAIVYVMNYVVNLGSSFKWSNILYLLLLSNFIHISSAYSFDMWFREITREIASTMVLIVIYTAFMMFKSSIRRSVNLSQNNYSATSNRIQKD